MGRHSCGNTYFLHQSRSLDALSVRSWGGIPTCCLRYHTVQYATRTEGHYHASRGGEGELLEGGYSKTWNSGSIHPGGRSVGDVWRPPQAGHGRSGGWRERTATGRGVE
eukprot:5263323-Prymnesium_polylepis.1